MATATEDLSIFTTRFEPVDAEFAETFRTTWKELCDENLIEEANRKGPIDYRLTPHGWIAGLKLTILWDDVEFRKKAGKLSKFLKDQIKGRDRDTLVPFNTVSKETDLMEGFIYNAIESHLLMELNNSHDAKWHHRGSYILIPTTFGLLHV